ncbi:MAG: GAF domain-containing protein [Deltaproteobacteria bacterium]|nr:GAF domain-containing protein [Deltaproteobacteria bacterium]
MDAITKHSNSLSDFFSTSELLSLNDLLNKIIDYGCRKLGCEGGSLFFFDGGTAKLELSAHSYSTARPLSFSLSPGEGVAGYAFIKQILVIALGKELTRLYLPFELFPRNRLRGVVALPVFVFKKPIAVFCFDFFLSIYNQVQTKMPRISLWKKKALCKNCGKSLTHLTSSCSSIRSGLFRFKTICCLLAQPRQI